MAVKKFKHADAPFKWKQFAGEIIFAITGMETMRLIQKGQLKYAAKGEGDVRAQNEMINKLFNIAA